MEKTNIELIQSIYAAFGRGDIGFIMGALAPDVLWEVDAPSSIPFAGVMRGPAEVGFFFDAIAKTHDTPKLEMNNFVASGNKVVVLGRYSATIKQTQQYAHSWLIHYFEVRDGKIAVYRNFFDTAAWATAHTF